MFTNPPSYDPITEVRDEPLTVDAGMLKALRAYRSQDKLVNLPGIDTATERERLSFVLNHLVDALVLGLQTNPSKLWVMRHFQQALVRVQLEDTEGREHFGLELEHVMELVGIESSDGLLNYYLVGW